MPNHWELTGTDLHEPKPHADSHTDGTDDIQDATASQKGLMTATQATKLNGIETGATTVTGTRVAAVTVAATAKSSPVDADLLALVNTESSNALAKMTVGELKALLKTYFDTLYVAQ